MKQAIVNFCKSTDTGLFLLDMPTGFGKTYSVLEFMVDYYDSPEFKDKKIFFVTTLKKNLPDKELREHFAKRGKADDYDKYCLRIEANADMVVEKLDELYRARKIPAAITMKQEFKDLHGSVKLLNEYRDKKRELKGTSKDIINVLCKNAEDAIRKQQEGAFRKVIESELKQFRTPKEKLKNIANNPEYHWIDYWKALRELCLMRPTLSRKNVEQNSQYQLVYMCAPGEITAYSYEQEGDYNKNINIKFDGSLPRKMSEDEVHLKEIMQIPGVKALFEKHGYATSFVPSEFILTPPMFNNIYKGALGEVVGKYILEQYAGVTLQEMPPEFFELFDYTLGNGVYVDFKLWKETMLISAEEEKKNVLEKLDKCGGKRAVIINIMLDHNMQITSSDNGRIIEIPYLYRLDRKEIGTEIIVKINREGYLQ